MTEAIAIDRLSKQYRIDVRERRKDTLAATVVDAMSAPLRNLRRLRDLTRVDSASEADDIVWALRAVSFAVAEGEIVGIIGRNGAGKSTLLKILSRITEPTSGCATVRGRVASLLEVGTGFHPELTGRENVYLNGTILGMTKVEVERKFDQIVEFSGVDRFIDTPVKRYSSGMQVRLAFAVAAHLEPEVLVVDEVLAVGDMAFQKKCLGKLGDLTREGRTVLFVSHNMDAIRRLCTRAVLLDGGRVVMDGAPHAVIARYTSGESTLSAARTWDDARTAPGNEWARLTFVGVKVDNATVTGPIDVRRPVDIVIEYEVLRPGMAMIPKLHIVADDGTVAFVAQDTDIAWRHTPRTVGHYRSTLRIPGNLLAEGTFSIWPAVVTHNPDTVHFFEPDAATVQVVDTLSGESARGDYAGDMPGVVRPLLRWDTERR
ncbi:MAG: putative O-antigen export system ATP-binding protein [Gemmatimonadetes bacterium]|nr:putative O-antigen export system ATP-binding protein [Gemmatimonadota bacterium]